MLGKGSIIVVFAFVVAISSYQLKLNRSVLGASDSFNEYYMRTVVHENALSVMNFGINKVWADEVTSGNYTIKTELCTSTVSISKIGLDTVKLSVNSWGNMFNEESYAKNGKSLKIVDSVYAYFSYTMPISRYFWFTNKEGTVYWITGDTVQGPVHTNGVLLTSGSPVFYGKVSANGGINPRPWKKSNKAKFYGGWEVGVYVQIPTDMTHLIDAANVGNGGAPVNTKAIYNKVSSFDFLDNGDVIRSVDYGPPDTVALIDIAPTGVIYSNKDVRVKGTLDGKLTILSTDDIWIDDDVVYADDPSSNPNSNDFLGLVAMDDIFVTDNYANNNDCYIQASMMAVNGSFGAQNYSSRPVSGVLGVTGSIVQKNRGPVGTFNSWTHSINHGFSKRYYFDQRLKSASAPYYPFVRALRLVAWWE